MEECAIYGAMCQLWSNVPLLEVKYSQYECQKAMLDLCKKVNYLPKIWATEKILTFLLGDPFP